MSRGNSSAVKFEIMSNEERCSIELPKYQCHKQVWALKIKSILMDSPLRSEASAEITPDDSRYAPFMVDNAYLTKHNPQAGGYYVVYPDGYKSFSPADAFEDGYTLIK